jgi:4-amino-4-deoxy-L-arabinose transferase
VTGNGVPVRRLWVLAALVFLAVGVVSIGVRPLQVPDEARYGIIPAQMVETGDWLSLRLAGFRFYEKPPLVYWITATSISAFGQNAVAIRLPSALAACGAALVAAWCAARITGRRELGPLAFMVQATTVMPMVLGTVTTLDPWFACLVAVTMGAFLGACTSEGRARILWLAAAGAAAGMGFLAKGLLAFAIPGAAALAFLAWERRWRDMVTMPWVPLCAALVALAPLALAVERANPGMWKYLVMKEHVRRALNPDPTQQPQPWWFYAVLFPAGALMWTLAWPRAAAGLRALGGGGGDAGGGDGGARLRSGVRFMLCWAFVPLVALSLSSGKLATYMLPMFAPVAVLVTVGLWHWRRAHSGDGGVSAAIARWVLQAAILACVIVAVAGPERFGIPQPWDSEGSNRLLNVPWESESSKRLLNVAMALAFWVLLDFWSWRAQDATTWLARTALAPVPMLACIPFLYPTALLDTAKHPWPFLAEHRDTLRASDVLIVAGGSPALATSWDTGRRDLVIAGWADEFDNELDLPEERERRIEWKAVADRVRAAREAQPPRTVGVVGQPVRLDELMKAAGVPAPTLRQDRKDLGVAVWR